MSGEQSLACLRSWVPVWEQGAFTSTQAGPGPQGRYSVQEGDCERLAAQGLHPPGPPTSRCVLDRYLLADSCLMRRFWASCRRAFVLNS